MQTRYGALPLNRGNLTRHRRSDLFVASQWLPNGVQRHTVCCEICRGGPWDFVTAHNYYCKVCIHTKDYQYMYFGGNVIINIILLQKSDMQVHNVCKVS